MCIKFAINGSVGILDVGGPIRKILVGAAWWHFEMHRMFGPVPVQKRTGRGRDGTRAFWDAVTLWAQQGERVDEAGVCVYERPQPKTLYHLGGGNYTEDPNVAARFGVEVPQVVDAVDPPAGSTGKPSTRD